MLRGPRNSWTSASGHVLQRKGVLMAEVEVVQLGLLGDEYPCMPTKRSAKAERVEPSGRSRRHRYDPVTRSKVCPVCGIRRPAEEFGWRRNGRSLNGLCKPCALARGRASYHRHRDTNVRRIYDAHALRKYGLTTEERDAIAEAEGWVCPICGDPLVRGGKGGMHVDHDHVTYVVRGVLCRDCNTGLGDFRDRPELLRRAIAWLETGGFCGGFDPESPALSAS